MCPPQVMKFVLKQKDEPRRDNTLVALEREQAAVTRWLGAIAPSLHVVTVLHCEAYDDFVLSEDALPHEAALARAMPGHGALRYTLRRDRHWFHHVERDEWGAHWPRRRECETLILRRHAFVRGAGPVAWTRHALTALCCAALLWLLYQLLN